MYKNLAHSNELALHRGFEKALMRMKLSNDIAQSQIFAEHAEYIGGGYEGWTMENGLTMS